MPTATAKTLCKVLSPDELCELDDTPNEDIGRITPDTAQLMPHIWSTICAHTRCFNRKCADQPFT